jgi:endoglycosylceramidase
VIGSTQSSPLHGRQYAPAPRRVALAALITTAAALLGACSDGGTEAKPRPGPGTLPPLHAVADPARGGRIVDSLGREVLLRGANVNALAEYWKGSEFPTTFPLAPEDPARMRSIGWNVVRLLVSWSRVEPEPGRYDEDHLDEVARTVARLGDAGLYSIIDLHQDAWGPTLAARPDESCTEGTEPAFGWDGAPGWATLDGGRPRCTSGARELSPAVMHAWQAFLDDEPAADGGGVQTRYVAMLAHVAGRFARTPEVAGYDLMNEPNTFTPSDNQRLATMYGRAVEAMRKAERAARGTSHLILFEPSALFSETGSGAPPSFSRDPDLVYAPHIYTGGFTGGPITRTAFETARREAAALGGVPVLSGEWGADPARAAQADDPYFVEHQRLQDAFRFGATLWTWRESCGDPHKAGDLRAGRVPEVWGVFEVDCRDNSIDGVREALVAQLRRGYVRAAPGTLTATRWDHERARLEASGELGARAGAAPVDLMVFHPAARVQDVRVTVRGLGAPQLEPVPGGGLLVSARATGGAWSIRVARVGARGSRA